MRFLMSFLILNEVLAQELIEILILEQSHLVFDEKNKIFFRIGYYVQDFNDPNFIQVDRFTLSDSQYIRPMYISC